MRNTFLIITSIASSENPVLKMIAEQSGSLNIPFIVVGDEKSPRDFKLSGCDYYSKEHQETLPFDLAKKIPLNHYSRKNIGYLLAISKGADIIIETDDDNLPLEGFWKERMEIVDALLVREKGWVNVYQYFTDKPIWPRGFSLEHIKDILPEQEMESSVQCPIQQGLVDENPDVDAIYRLVLPLPFNFRKSKQVALGKNSICPFNSQNTTWFKDAFPLLYLPSYCSFRMTDIWRSFVAQRIAWTCGWSVLFHESTVRQERNDHRLMQDFFDEEPGYHNNARIVDALDSLLLRDGIQNVMSNMVRCYQELIRLELVGANEMSLLKAWLSDVKCLWKKI